MIITICGMPGAGKSTTAKALAKRLGFKHYSGGDLIRIMAQEKGMNLNDFRKLQEKDESFDHEVDNFQKELAKREDNFVIDGRTSAFFIPHGVKIYLDADQGVRAERIMKQKRETEKFIDLRNAMEGIERREEGDRKRYIKLYGFDVHDKSKYDFIIDTTKTSVDDVVEKIIKFLESK